MSSGELRGSRGSKKEVLLSRGVERVSSSVSWSGGEVSIAKAGRRRREKRGKNPPFWASKNSDLSGLCQLCKSVLV